MHSLVRNAWMLKLVVIAIVATLAGKATAHLLSAAYLVSVPLAPRPRPAPPVEKPRAKDGAATLLRNVFCSGCTRAPDGPAPPGGDGGDGPRATTLPIELVSTLIVPSDERWSMAILCDLSTRTRDPAMYNKGKSIAGAVVVKVLPRRVYLRNAGRLEYLDLEAAPAVTTPATVAEAKPPAPADPLLGSIDRDVRCQSGRCTIARALVDKLLGNMALLASSVHVMPLSKDGHGAGFRLDAIRAGSLFAHLGLQNGDTLRAVNGTELTTPDSALALYTKLRTASHVALGIERGGSAQTLDYTIE